MNCFEKYCTPIDFPEGNTMEIKMSPIVNGNPEIFADATDILVSLNLTKSSRAINLEVIEVGMNYVRAYTAGRLIKPGLYDAVLKYNKPEIEKAADNTRTLRYDCAINIYKYDWQKRNGQSECAELAVSPIILTGTFDVGGSGGSGRDGRSPYIGDNGNWFEYDDQSQVFVDTGVSARGPVFSFTETGDGNVVTDVDYYDDPPETTLAVRKNGTLPTKVSELQNDSSYVDSDGLNQRVEPIESQLNDNTENIAQNTLQIQALQGAVIYLGHINLTTNDLEGDGGQDALTDRANEIIAEQQKPPLKMGYTLIDLNNNDWWYNDSGEWINIGYSAVSTATNSTLGVVMGKEDVAENNGDISVRPDGTMHLIGDVPQITGSPGSSTSLVMSQRATTSMVFADPDTQRQAQIGSGALATGNGATALGQGAVALPDNSAALGANSKVFPSDLESSDWGVASFGNSVNATTQRRLINVAPGIRDNDAVTKKQLNVVEGKIPEVVQTKGISETEVMSQRAASDLVFSQSDFSVWIDPNQIRYNPGTRAVVIGSGANGGYNQSVAIGANSICSAPRAVTIGADSALDGEELLSDEQLYGPVSIGSIGGGIVRRVMHVKDGVKDNDAVNLRQLKESSSYERGFTIGSYIGLISTEKRSAIIRTNLGGEFGFGENTPIPEGFEMQVKIYNTASSPIIIQFPNDDRWDSKNPDGSNMDPAEIPVGGSLEVNVWSLDKYIVKTDA